MCFSETHDSSSEGIVFIMNSVEQAVFSSSFNTACRSVEFNSNGLKIMVNTPKCCKKVIINENMSENEIKSCDTNCSDTECNGKSMTFCECSDMEESECSDMQDSINEDVAKEGSDNVINTNSKLSSKMKIVVRKSGVGNTISEGKQTKNLKILFDKSVVDNYVLDDKIGNTCTDKLCEYSGRSELTNVQHVTSPKESSCLVSKSLGRPRNCERNIINKNAMGKRKSTIPKYGTKSYNAGKKLLIGKDPKVIVRTFNINTNRHILDNAQKSSDTIIFPTKYQASNNRSINFDTEKIISSNLHTNDVLSLETQNTTLLNDPQPVKLTTNNVYFSIKDLRWKRLQPKDPNKCPYCSRCLAKNDAQTQTDFTGLNTRSGVIIGRVALDSSNLQSGTIKLMKKDLKNMGKLVYINKEKIVSGYSNNVDGKPQTPFRIIYKPDFIKGIRKGNLDVSNMSDSHSSGHITNNADKNSDNASCLLNGDANNSSEVVTDQIQISSENKLTRSLSDSSQRNSTKNVNQGDGTDQHIYIINESDVESDVCSEENIIDVNKSKTNSVDPSISNYTSGDSTCKDNLIERDIGSCKANLVEDGVISCKPNLVEGGDSSCKDNLIEYMSCKTPLTSSSETLTTANSLHGTDQYEYLHELRNPNVGSENNSRAILSMNNKNTEEIYKNKTIEDSCLTDKVKTAVSQDKLLNSVMWPTSFSVVQKETNDEIRMKKLIRTMYKDWLNCQKEDEDGNLPLHRAVLSNSIPAVTRQTIILKALEANSTYKAVNHQNREGYTALMIAAGIPDVKEDIVAILVHRFHVDQTVRNKNSGNTALHIAANSGNTKCVKLLLLAQGAMEIVNLFNDEGLAPLHIAARHGHSDIIRELVDKEADINLKDKRGGYTPLYHAWNGDHKDACNVLMGLGAECSDTYFSDQLYILGSDTRTSESTLLFNGRKRKQKITTDKNYTSEKSSDDEYTSKKGKYN